MRTKSWATHSDLRAGPAVSKSWTGMPQLFSSWQYPVIPSGIFLIIVKVLFGRLFENKLYDKNPLIFSCPYLVVSQGKKIFLF